MTFPERIFLIGLPGSGKSTFGKYLAREVGYSFYDMDDLIESREKQSISDIFRKNGEPYFRQLETDVLRSLDVEKMVVATGGGTPCFNNNMEWMNVHGTTVFLNAPIETVVSRVREMPHRPLIGTNPTESITELLSKRISFYKQANLESSLTDSSEILAELRNSSSDK